MPVIQPHAAASVPVYSVAAPPALFRDVSASVRHVHVDESYDGFARQPLLPRKLSTLGPGVARADADADADGADDLVVTGGKTGLQVRWPGGASQEFAWPAGARSVEVSTEGIRGR